MKPYEFMAEQKRYRCFRCNYDWPAKDKEPDTCANEKCRSPYWRIPRRSA